MWELICHHTYKLHGIPVDLSDYDSSGRPERLNDGDFASDGAAPGSGIVRFPRSGSRIRLPTSGAWNPLGGINVEVVARFSSEAHIGGGDIARQRTLVAGHNAFSFQIFLQRPSASFQGDPIGINLTDHAAGGAQLVPLNRWVKLRFLHDGLSTAQLYIDDQLAAQRSDLTAGIPPVGPLGVSIGNEAHRDDRFLSNCEVDEVRVWRLDPREVGRKFLSRPLDSAAVDCWKVIFSRILTALDGNPKCREQLLRELPAEIDRHRRLIAALGPEARQIYNDFCETYAGLWKAGQLDSPEMAGLLKNFCGWLRESGVMPSIDPGLAELVTACLGDLLREPGLLDCDPQAAAFLQLLIDGCDFQEADHVY